MLLFLGTFKETLLFTIILYIYAQLHIWLTMFNLTNNTLRYYAVTPSGLFYSMKRSWNAICQQKVVL
jgi:hypothetical protein